MAVGGGPHVEVELSAGSTDLIPFGIDPSHQHGVGITNLGPRTFVEGGDDGSTGEGMDGDPPPLRDWAIEVDSNLNIYIMLGVWSEMMDANGESTYTVATEMGKQLFKE
jgi:hypothetical protein